MEPWYRVEELGEGVYAVIDVDGGWFRSNTGLVDMGDYTLVVDTQYNEPRTREVLRVIEQLGLPAPRLLVNTHHHGDHAFGNHIVQGALKVMHPRAAEAARALAPLVPDVYKAFFPHLDFEGSKYSEPDVEAEGPLVVNGRRGRVMVYHPGPGHTVGDLVVYVEWSGVLFAGDLVFNGVTPLAIDGSVEKWIQTLEKLVERHDGATVVPGHGPPAPLAGAAARVKGYLSRVMDHARRSIEQGVRDPLRAALAFDLGEYGSWKEAERLVMNIERAMMDLEGRPPGEAHPDLPGLAARMMEYARRLAGGGPP